MTKFTKNDEGKRIRLIARIRKNDQYGILLNVDKKSETIIVSVDDEYVNKKSIPFDDGLREAAFEYGELIK